MTRDGGGAIWVALGEYVGPKSAHVFMHYALECRRNRVEEESYRIYVTDALMALCGISVRYNDIINPREDYDARQVCERIIDEAGLEVIG